jgi:hypothetical protein
LPLRHSGEHPFEIEARLLRQLVRDLPRQIEAAEGARASILNPNVEIIQFDLTGGDSQAHTTTDLEPFLRLSLTIR